MTKFLSPKIVIWKVEIVTDYASTKKPIEIFVSASDLVNAHYAAMVWGQETISKDVLIKSVKLVTDCILDGGEE